jgi:pimeloyl-ACP methyl ester carboxylesterase
VITSTEHANLNGSELRYLRVGTGAPVILIHTLRTQLEYFGPLVGQVDTTRVEVTALDLPGHGESSAPHVDYTAGYFTDAVAGLLELLDVRDVTLVGESIGGAIALGLGARANQRVAQVVALNPYDYGWGGGIRRASSLNYALFTCMLWPGIGPIIAHAETEAILRRVMAGGLHDQRKLPNQLVHDMSRCGSLPGHARAFRSLSREWRSWIDARSAYAKIAVPVTLAYGEDDWSRPAEREANANAIPHAITRTIAATGHFSCLEQPQAIAEMITSTLPSTREPAGGAVPRSAGGPGRCEPG